MKAVIWTQYGPPELLAIKEVARPVPKEDELLINVHGATVTPGDCEMRRYDMHILFWLPLRIYFGLFRPKRPILGMELAGEVVETGKDVKNFKVGDRVFCSTGIDFGAHAEYKCVKDNGPIAHMPDNMTYAEAATLPTGASNALHFMRLGSIKPGDKVLIIGAAGCFGIYAIQLAKMFGAEVTGIDSTTKLDVVRSIGADHVIDYTKEDFTQNGQSYDMIFDVRGNTVARNMKSLTPEGRYILATPWVLQVLQGLWVEKMSKKKFLFRLAGESKEDLEYLKGLVDDGKLKAIVDKTFSLDQVPEAHRYVESGQKVGHVVISVIND